MTGAYNCYCNLGYYFPKRTNGTRAYSGKDLDDYVRHYGAIKPGMFQCAACASGCETCVDSSPCVHEHEIVLKVMLLVLTSLTVVGIAIVAVVTYVYRNNKVI